MKEFRYSALTNSGHVTTGVRQATSADELAAALLEHGLVLLKSRPTLGTLGGGFSVSRRNAKRELRDFTQHMATCLSAGVPAISALADYQLQSKGMFAEVVADIRGEVSSGASLDEAFGRHPEIFPQVYLALVAAGQNTGGLDEAFEELTSYIEWQEELRSQTVQALIYPAMLLTAVIGLFLLMMLFVVPRFESMFADSGLELPGITVKMMSMGRFFGRWWWAMGAGLLVTIAVAKPLLATRRGAYLRDKMLLSLPVLGSFQRKLALSRFAKSFSLIFASGVDLLRLLDLLGDVVGNKVMAHQLSRIRRQVASGQNLAESFAAADVFPPLIQRMVAVGEKTGSLDRSLMKASIYLDKEIPRDLKKAFTIFEGIVIAVLGVMICVAALSLLMPIMQIRGSVH